MAFGIVYLATEVRIKSSGGPSSVCLTLYSFGKVGFRTSEKTPLYFCVINDIKKNINNCKIYFFSRKMAEDRPFFKIIVIGDSGI